MSAQPTKKPDVKTEPDQTDKPQPTPPTTPTIQTLTPNQTPAQTEPKPELPLTGSSKAEKTVEYLKRLRERGQFDPNQPLSNEQAKNIAEEVSKLAGEEISPSTVKDARARLLKEPVKQALQPASKPSDESRPQPKTPPIEPQKTAEAPKPEKPPLKPEEIESNKKFFDRFLNWLNKKAEASVDPADHSFIVDTLTDTLTDSKSKVPLSIKVGIAIVMIATLYIWPALMKIRNAFSKVKQVIVKKPETTETKP